MKLLVVFNPAAGNGRAKRYRARIEQALECHRIDAQWFSTRAAGEAREWVAAASLASYDGVAAAGGDGTLFEVINGLKQHPEPRPPLGILPVGTGNAFARELGLASGDCQQAAQIIANGQQRRLDLARFQAVGASGHFINVLGSGFVSDVAALAHRLKIFGNFAYTLAIFLRLAGLKARSVALEIDGRTIQRDNVFVEVCNSRYTADFLIAPEAELDDGLLDVVLLNRCSRRRLIANFTKVMDGSHLELDEVELFKARQLSISSNQASALTPDGEVLGSTPVSIECEAAALSVFWPGPTGH